MSATCSMLKNACQCTPLKFLAGDDRLVKFASNTQHVGERLDVRLNYPFEG